MDFSLSDEQKMLQDSVQRFIQNDYGFEARRALTESEDGFSRDHWKQFAELGWLGLPFKEDDGGFGGTAIETALVMEQFGRGLVVEPYLATVVLAGGAIARAGSTAQKEKWLAGIIEGTVQAAVAYAEPQSRFNLADVSTSAKADGQDFVLSGHKSVVLNGPAADVLVVSARTAGQSRDADGITLFLVPTATAGVSRRDYPTVDGFRAAEVTLENVRVAATDVLGDVGAGLPVLEAVVDDACLAVGAEATGAMEVMYKDTVEYTKQREQFGQPIAKFQVLQHRMVDMFMEHEQAKSLMYMAALRRADAPDSQASRKAVSALKVQVGKSGRFVGQSAVQLHGGMGVTEELHVGHYFRRLTVIETLFGSVDHHLRRFGSL